MKRTKATEEQSAVHVLVPLTEEERIALKHKALDQRCTVGVMIRQALGLSGDAPPQRDRRSGDAR